MPLVGYSWTCLCGGWADNFHSEADRDNALVNHTRRCRRMPSGTVVRSARGRLLYVKP